MEGFGRCRWVGRRSKRTRLESLGGERPEDDHREGEHRGRLGQEPQPTPPPARRPGAFGRAGHANLEVRLQPEETSIGPERPEGVNRMW